MMPRFLYLGDHAEVTLYGVTFPQGKPVAVENPVLLGKLRGNNHFSEVIDGAEVMPDLPIKRKPGRPRKDA